MKIHSFIITLGLVVLSSILFTCEEYNINIYSSPYHEVDQGHADFGYKVIRITKFDMAVISREYNKNDIDFHLKISSTTQFKEDGNIEQVDEKVFLDDHFTNQQVLRVSVPETYANFHIVISAAGYQTKTFDKTLKELKFYDNFHRSDDSSSQVWIVALKKNNIVALKKNNE